MNLAGCRYCISFFSGVYECQISTAPVRSLRFNLQVVGSKASPFNLAGKLNYSSTELGQNNNEIASRTFLLLILEIELFVWLSKIFTAGIAWAIINLTILISDSYTTIPGNAVRHVDAGSLLNISCLVVNFPLKLDYMIFYHNDQV